MLNLRSLALAGALATAAAAPFTLLPGATIAQAGGTRAFTPAAFAAAQKSGGPILVAVGAPWCSICRLQKPVLASLAREPRYAKLTILQVDFDTQKDVLNMLGVSSQSTLISYRGAAEVGRSTAVVDANAIDAQLSRSL